MTLLVHVGNISVHAEIDESWTEFEDVRSSSSEDTGSESGRKNVDVVMAELNQTGVPTAEDRSQKSIVKSYIENRDGEIF